MGISIARTISRIKPPIKIVITGSKRESITALFDSISDFIKSATFLNILTRLPERKPLEISWINISGKISVLLNA
jgi:hypothetical protein